jgi:UDP-N-acetylglucosamine 2-epimerase
MRVSDERWETVEAGGNFVVGTDPLLIASYVRQIIGSDLGKRMRKARNPYGIDVAEKIIRIMRKVIR